MYIGISLYIVLKGKFILSAFFISDAERILSVCEKCLQQNRNCLHPLNLNYVKILDCVFDAAVDLQFWDKAILFGTQTLPAYR